MNRADRSDDPTIAGPDAAGAREKVTKCFAPMRRERRAQHEGGGLRRLAPFIISVSVHRLQEPFHHLEKRLRLLDVRHVARLLEELPARAWDARVDLLDDVRRRFVVPA